MNDGPRSPDPIAPALRLHKLLFLALILPVYAGAVSAAPPTWADKTPIVSATGAEQPSLLPAANWEGRLPQRWPGPTMWTNRLQDWEVRDGGLWCRPKDLFPCRTAHLLTYDLSPRDESFFMEVTVRLDAGSEEAGFAGFLIGAGEGRLDYRGASLVHHLPGKGGGILAVLETSQEGALVFRDMSRPETEAEFPVLPGQETRVAGKGGQNPGAVRLYLGASSAGENDYTLRLSAWDEETGSLLGAQEIRNISAGRLIGNVALVSHPDGRKVCHVFREFRVGGAKFDSHPERTFGPIAGTLYSLSGGVLKLGAQFTHLGEAVGKERNRLGAYLEARPVADPGEEQPAPWTVVDATRAVSPPDYHLLFRVEDWDSSHDWEVRVVFNDDRGETYTYEAFVGKDPVMDDTVSLAAFTGMGVVGRTANAQWPKPGDGEVIVGRWTPANIWIPFAEAVRALQQQNLDILFFTGDQVYEGKPSPKDPSRAPNEDYLYKWLLWHWSFRELTRRLPALVQPDDHDVYHGNLWGWGGRLCLTNKNWNGGYLCSPYFVNLVHRTQTAHNPDPYDPIPVKNGITNHYCGFTYGGIGFAVLEDRKFKTPPSVTAPEEQVLLGEKQLELLKKWGEDWTGQKFKAVVSQTVYASMHVGFEGQLAKDADSNGFPKVGRDRAVSLFQRCGALVISGDQHLGTFSRLGVEVPSDAVYQFCVPAMGNIFWRWFYPETPGVDRGEDVPAHLGEFTDAWGNPFRMIAVANPERRELLHQKLRQRSIIPEEEAVGGHGDSFRTCLGDGYGIVRFHKDSRGITVECWPHNADPKEKSAQFSGWPITLRFEDLDGRRPAAWLPDLLIEGSSDPVVEIIDEGTEEIVKTTRAKEGFYRPPAYDGDTRYTVRVGDPDCEQEWWSRKHLRPSRTPGERRLKVKLRP